MILPAGESPIVPAPSAQGPWVGNNRARGARRGTTNVGQDGYDVMPASATWGGSCKMHDGSCIMHGGDKLVTCPNRASYKLAPTLLLLCSCGDRVEADERGFVARSLDQVAEQLDALEVRILDHQARGMSEEVEHAAGV